MTLVGSEAKNIVYGFFVSG